MKSMGTPPPRSKETDAIKCEIWANKNEKLNMAPTPDAVMSDQLGHAAFQERRERGWFDCCICGEPYQFGKGFVHDGSWDSFWCESCFREMALEKYGTR